MTYTPADLARIALTLVRVCANGHPTVLYYARRDEPEPPCPSCGAVQRRA